MIQWGRKADGGSYQGTITLPLSFYDNNYSLLTSSTKGSPSDNSSWSANFLAKTKTGFNYICTWVTGTAEGTSIAEFFWIAIGRWK